MKSNYSLLGLSLLDQLPHSVEVNVSLIQKDSNYIISVLVNTLQLLSDDIIVSQLDCVVCFDGKFSHPLL